MKKLLFIVLSFNSGGTEKALLEVLKKIDTEKYSVTVQALFGNGALYDDFKKISQERGIKLCYSFEKIRSSNSLIRKIINRLFIVPVEQKRFKNPKTYRKKAIQDDYDVEIAFGFDGIPQIIACSDNEKSQKIAWLHSNFAFGWCTWTFKGKEFVDECYSKFDKVVCVSKAVEESFLNYLGHDMPTVVIKNPLDIDKIFDLAKQEIEVTFSNSDLPVLACIGRLSAEKAVDRLLRAQKQLLDRKLPFNLIIVGDGKERESLEKFVDENNLRDYVKFAGYTNNPYMYIQKCDVIVISSHIEGLPIVAQEALLLSKPVISTQPCVAEIFEQYQCGIVTENDENSLIEGLYKALSSPEILNKLKSESIELSKRMFRINEIFVEDFDKMLNER